MAETAPPAAVGFDELAALKLVALDGGSTGPVKVSCSGLGDRLDASSQTASRRLQRLESAGYLDRDVGTDGQWVELTAAGKTALRREYEDYRRIFEGTATIRLQGSVTGGMGEGRHYISLPGYMEQFRERLGYEPFPGTLNVDLPPESVRARAGMTSLDAIAIDGWADDERTFGAATCYPVRLDYDGRTFEPAHVIVPNRTHHDETQLEVIAPVHLREELSLDDDDQLTITVEEV